MTLLLKALSLLLGWLLFACALVWLWNRRLRKGRARLYAIDGGRMVREWRRTGGAR